MPVHSMVVLRPKPDETSSSYPYHLLSIADVKTRISRLALNVCGSNTQGKSSEESEDVLQNDHEMALHPERASWSVLPQGTYSIMLTLVMRSVFSDDLLAQHQAGLTDVHSMWTDGQVSHLLLVFPTERAAQPLLFRGCFGAVAQGRDAFVADINPSRSGNEALHLVLLFATKGAHQHWLPLLFEDLDDVRSYFLQAEAKAFQHPCPYSFALSEQS